MAVKFFARFNLHNSISQNPVSVELLRPHFNMTDSEIADMLCEIDEIQNARAKRLAEKCLSQVKLLTGKKVLFVGDSITSDNLGYRDTVTRAACLGAIDGSVSGGMSTYILHDVKMFIKEHKPDIVSIMIGSNDSVGIGHTDLNQVSVGEYMRNVGKMVQWANESGSKVLLFEVPPVVEERFEKHFSANLKVQTNDNISRYNEALKEIADKNGIGLYSNGWLSDDEDNFEPDGIHLSVNGHERFAEKWLIAAANKSR